MSQPRKASSRPRAEEKKEAEDLFVEKTLEVMKWAKANGQILILVGVAVVVLAAGGIYYKNFRSNWEEQAVARLEAVESAFNYGDRETAEADLRQYVEQFDGTVYAMEARLVLGQALLEDGKPEEAVDVLAPSVREMDSEPIGIQAAFLLAAAYEEAGRLQDAETLYLRIANTSELTFQVREALAGAARIRTTNGDMAGAAELYEEVVAAMDEGDPDRDFWEMRLAEVRGHLKS
jgi:predicted negative regulator of RcsB-dependent stress response